MPFQSPSRTIPSYQSNNLGPVTRYSPVGGITGTGAVNRAPAGDIRSLLEGIGPLGTGSSLFGPLFPANLSTATTNPLNLADGSGRQVVANILGQTLVPGNPALSSTSQAAGTVYGTPTRFFKDLTQNIFDSGSDDASALLAALPPDAREALAEVQRIFGELRTSVANVGGSPGGRNTFQIPDFFSDFRPGTPDDIQSAYDEFLRLIPEQTSLDDPLPQQTAFSAEQFEPTIDLYNKLAVGLAGTDPTTSNELFLGGQKLGALSRGNERASQGTLDTLQNALAQAQGARSAVSQRYQDQSYNNLDQFYQNLDAVDADAAARMDRIDQDYSALTDQFKAREQQALGLLGTLGGTEKRQLGRGFAQQRAQQAARNISSGLTNTTVAGAQDRRLREQEAEQYGDLQQRLTEQQLGILGQFTGDTLRTSQAGLQAREPLNQAAMQAQISGLGRGADAADSITRTSAELDARTADAGDAWSQALAQFQKDQTLTGSELANMVLQLDAKIRPGV